MQNQRLTRIITDSSELTETYIVGLPMDLRNTVKGYVEHSYNNNGCRRTSIINEINYIIDIKMESQFNNPEFSDVIIELVNC